MQSSSLRIIGAAALTSLSCLVLGQQGTTPTSAAKNKKVCIADVANSSMQPIFTNRLKERLAEDLQKRNVNAYSAYAATVLATQLGVSATNKMVMRREKCDYMLLSEVARPKAGSSGQAAEADTGPKKASAGRAAIDFAIFKKGQLSKPVLANTVTTTPADDPTEAALTAMDEVAAQVIQYFSKR